MSSYTILTLKPLQHFCLHLISKGRCSDRFGCSPKIKSIGELEFNNYDKIKRDAYIASFSSSVLPQPSDAR